jgi:Fic family protein
MRRKNYIHELPGWPELRWSAAALADTLATIRHKQGRLLGRMEGLRFDVRQNASLTTLTSDVVNSSAIEGERLDAEQVRSSIASRMGLDAGGLPRASRDVEGIVEVMLDATQNFQRPLTADRLFGWHAALFPAGRSGMHRITTGAWRRDELGPMRVVSGHQQQRVHFEAPAAPRLPDEMARFLGWFEASTTTDPVLRAGVAHLWFVTIHPFDDGNGRIARAIADMMLARSDASPDRFYSMSTQIERQKSEYYAQLERQQNADLDITPWLDWFLRCLDKTLDASDGALQQVLLKGKVWERINRSPVNPRQQAIINRLLGPFEGHLTTSKYAALARCSADTALRDIQELLARGILVQNPGGGRSTSYRLADPDAILG